MFSLELSFSKKELQKAKVDFQQFQKLLEKTERQIPVGHAHGTVAVILVDATGIRDLNRRFRQKDSATDVLSFSLADKAQSGPEQIFGEIYIALPVAQEQARIHHHNLQAELNTLFVHGLLHLLGYDHENETDFKKMNALEKIILNCT